MNVAFVYAGGREGRLEGARLGNIPTDFFYGAIEFEQINHKICAYDLNPRPLLIADLLNLFFDGWMPPKTRITDIVAAGRLLKSLQNCDVVVATSSGCAFALGFWKKLGFLSSELVGIHCGIVNCEHDRWRQQSARVLLKTMKPVLFADNEIAEMRRQFCAERLFCISSCSESGRSVKIPTRPANDWVIVGGSKVRRR